MKVMPDRPTRIAADLLDSAATEGARQSRSAKQQLDHWARVGRTVSMTGTAARRRVEAALAGAVALRDLEPAERTVVNAELDADLAERARGAHFGRALADRGVTTVALDDDGVMRRYHPDGRTELLA